MERVQPYGTWSSPITAPEVAAASPRLEGARFVGDELWWGEGIPEEGGRTAIKRRTGDGTVETVLPSPWNARSRVHEYGGGAWTTAPDGTLYFVEKTDQRVWELTAGGQPRALTPPAEGAAYGGLTWQAGRLLAIREHQTEASDIRRAIVEISTDRMWDLIELTADSDFLAQPALSPGGRHLAWVAWNHPDMPWDRTELRIGRLEDGIVVEWATVAGGDSAPLQPVWLDDDDLLYADDSTGRWNLWRMRLDAGLDHEDLAPADADTGGPLWVLGARWYGRLDDGRIVAIRTDGRDEIVVIDPATGVVSPLALDVCAGVTIEDVSGTRVLLTGASHEAPAALWLVDVDRPAEAERVAGGAPPAGPEWMPQPRAVVYDGPHGPVHAFDYAPRNPHVSAPDGELPPYVLLVHGGPTSHVAGAASGRVAFFTSRGIGVLDVNYGGSSGYGREYRERLRGQWGVVDVDDVAASAAGLIAEGRVDPARLTIAGGSAGGWTVLAALVQTDVFAAGISRYGVGDARALAADTHDFESHYLDGLIGPLPDAEAVYLERSPLSHSERFRVPILLLQGADDLVVPPSQSEAIRDALRTGGVPHAYVLYTGEGHGFRRAETLVDALEKELAFLGGVYGFDTPGVPRLELD